MNENIEHKQNSTNFRRFSKEELDDFDPINEIAKNLKEN